MPLAIGFGCGVRLPRNFGRRSCLIVVTMKGRASASEFVPAWPSRQRAAPKLSRSERSQPSSRLRALSSACVRYHQEVPWAPEAALPKAVAHPEHKNNQNSPTGSAPAPSVADKRADHESPSETPVRHRSGPRHPIGNRRCGTKKHNTDSPVFIAFISKLQEPMGHSHHGRNSEFFPRVSVSL